MLELDVATELALRAGEKILDHYNAVTIQEWTKTDKTIVTNADLSSNQIIIEGLKDNFPRHAILSEENMSQEDEKTRSARIRQDDLWIVDPLDGTSDFKLRTGNFSVMIAYVHKGQPIVGVVYAPVLGKLYTAQALKGAFLKENGQTRQLNVSARALDECTIMLSRKEFSEEQAEEIRQKFGVKGFIQSGSMGIKVGHIVEGRADLYVNNDPHGGEWDSAASGLVLTEAGGKITDYDNKPPVYNKEAPYLPRGAVCTTGPIHDPVLKLAELVMPIKKYS